MYLFKQVENLLEKADERVASLSTPEKKALDNCIFDINILMSYSGCFAERRCIEKVW